MKNNLITTVIFVIVIFSACKKDVELNTREHPIIITKEVTEINSTGITLNAKITDLGQDNIIDYGFILTSENAEYIYSIFEYTALDQFNKRVTILEENTEYSCRAYLETSKHTVYANIVSFFSQGSSSPIFPDIENYYPKGGHDNTNVIINGKYFNLFLGEKSVTVNNIEAQIISWEDNYIEFITPKMSFFGDTKIELNFNDKSISLDYNVLGPEFTSALNTSGHSGSFLKIFGNNFIPEDTKVFFGDYEAEVISISNLEIELLVAPIFNQTQDYYKDIIIYSGQKVLNTGINYLILTSWTEKSPLPFKHFEKDAFIYNNKGYIFNSEYRDLWEYNTGSDTWTLISEFPQPTYHNSLFIIFQDKLFIMGGENYLGSPVHDLWEYDFINGNWTQLADIPFGFLNSTYFIIDGIYYIVTDEAECWTFDPSDMNYTQKNNFPEDVNKHSLLFSYWTDNDVFITTDYNSWKYNVSYDTWTLEISHNFSYSDSNGMAFNNTAYVKDDWKVYKYFSEYNNWYQVSYFPSSFDYYIATFVFNDKAYFVTGNNYYVEPAEMFMYEE